MLPVEAIAVNSGNSTLITILAALLGGGLTTATAQLIIARRGEHRDDNKTRKQEARELYIANETRDSLISEAADRAVEFMRKSLDQAQRQLNEAQTAIVSLNGRIEQLQRELQQGEGERESLRKALTSAIAERGAFESKANSLEDRVHELEVRVGARRFDDPPHAPISNVLRKEDNQQQEVEGDAK